MTESENDGGWGTSLLRRAHRVIRTLDATEGPFAGTLVTQGDGVAVRVDAAALGGWVGWRFSGAEHVAAPVDVGRRIGGHDVLLPWCTERVLAFLFRRTASGGCLTAGECSTLVVSLLRGLDEVGEGVDGLRTGVWWLTEGGRPVFVFGDGPDARVGVTEIIEQVRDHSTDKMLTRVLGAIAAGLEKVAAQPRLPRKLTESWEQELLSIAAPQPLERGAHAPERARDVARAVTPGESGSPPRSQRLRADRIRRRDVPHVGTAELVQGIGRTLVRSISARLRRLRDLLPARTSGRARSRSRVEGKPEAPPRLRRRTLLVAGVAAATVLAGGMLWPDGDASGEPPITSTGASSQAPAEWSGETGNAESPPPTVPTDEEADPGDGPESSAVEDPAAATVTLLETIERCHARGDAACPDAVAAGSDGVMEALAGVAPERSTAELVDEYGDVAVIRLRVGDSGDAAGEASMHLMVVLIRMDEKWLIRDVYDVADQPR